MPIRIDRRTRWRVRRFSVPVLTGATWTTDAPFRETQPAIDAMREKKLLAVEMEASALYAFAQVRQKPVLCFAHVTNQMGRVDGDFEKGEADGSKDALNLIAIAADRLRSRLGCERSRPSGSCAKRPAGPRKNTTGNGGRRGCRRRTVRLLSARRCRSDRGGARDAGQARLWGLCPGGNRTNIA